MRFLVFLVLVASFCTGEKINYENYKIIKLSLKSNNQLQFVQNLVESNKNYTFWSLIRDRLDLPITVLIAPDYFKRFIKQMDDSNIQYEVIIDNIQSLINHQITGVGNEKSFAWKRYHTLEEIYGWLDSLPNKYPGKVETIIGGHSYEGRDIKGVKISYKKNNPGIFIEGGIHTNEWISPATVTFLINQILNSNEAKVQNLVKSYDWYIFPIFNPDGYEYSYTKDRLWRKSKSQHSDCTGVDLNRNWDYMWMKIGASNDSCNLKYAGKGPFSEPETKSMSEYIKSIANKLFAYISFHSFAQLLTLPYGNTKDHLDNYNETYAIGLKAVKALSRRYGTVYKVGNVAEAIGPSSGASTDWVKSTLKLPIVYTYELRDQGNFGVLLPPEQIIPTGEEILDSLIVLFEEARTLGYPRKLLKKSLISNL